MAITITDSPTNFSPVYAPLIYIVDEPTLTSEDNFKYIAEVYKGTTKLAELKAVPNPEFNWGRFNISEIIQNEVKEVVNFDSGVFSAQDGLVEIQVRFGWEYIASNGTYTRVENNTSNTNKYFNGSITYNEFIQLREQAPFQQHVITSGTGYEKYPLTSRRTIETFDTTKQWLYYLTINYNEYREIEIQDIDASAVDTIPLPPGLQNSSEGEFVAFRVDKGFVEANTTLTDIKNWRVRTIDELQDPTSEWINFTLKQCNKWSPYSLYYLNRWGGVDSISMNGRSSKTIQTDRETYINDSRSVNASGVVDYSIDKHTRKAYHTNQTDIYELTSDWISYEMKESAIDLQTSPIAWLENEDGLILPVNVINEDFVIVDKNNTEPIMVSMTVEYNEQINRQKV